MSARTRRHSSTTRHGIAGVVFLVLGAAALVWAIAQIVTDIGRFESWVSLDIALLLLGLGVFELARRRSQRDDEERAERRALVEI